MRELITAVLMSCLFQAMGWIIDCTKKRVKYPSVENFIYIIIFIIIKIIKTFIS